MTTWYRWSIIVNSRILPMPVVAMDPRLEEVSHVGDVDALHRLLQQDRLLLDRLTTTPTDNPLHIAALLGHANFVREIIRRKPSLARDLNTHGLSPMHLASASGHLPVVKELLKEGGSELCLVRDKDGLMPIHSAAFKGRVQVLAELMEACPESAREQACSGDTVLHLVMRSHCFEAVKLLVERIDGEDALNSKDEKGNTVLHLAVAMRQLQITKFLLTQSRIDVNGVNVKGLTALDVLLELPREHGDLALGEMIRAAGGKTAGVGETLQPAQTPAQTSSITVIDPLTRLQSRSTSWMRQLRQAGLWFGRPSASRSRTMGRQRVKAHPDSEIKGAVMVVATLIATITFQSGLNPPGGFDSKTGKAVLGEYLGHFLIADMIGLFASLSVILLFICAVPRRSQKQQLTRTLLWVMWLAVYSTALAFSFAANKIFPQTLAVSILVQGWYMILLITIVWVHLRFAFHLLGKVGWWNKNKTHDVPRMGLALVMKRILVVLVILAPIPVVGSLLTFELPFLKNRLTWNVYIVLVQLLIISAPLVWAYLRLVICLLRKVRWWEKAPVAVDGESNAPTPTIVIKRILVLVMIVGTPLAVRLLIFWLDLSYLKGLGIFLGFWLSGFVIPIIWICHRFILYLLRMVGWWKEHWDGESNAQQMNVARVITRTAVIMVFVVAVYAVGILYFYITIVIFPENY